MICWTFSKGDRVRLGFAKLPVGKPCRRPYLHSRYAIMNSIKVIDTGIVYRNQKPHLRAVNAMHPTVSVFADGEIVSTYDLGQGSESMDYRTELSRSTDGGKTWQQQGPLIATPRSRPSTHSIRTSLLSDGRMIGL